jgi:hypothetical protein
MKMNPDIFLIKISTKKTQILLSWNILAQMGHAALREQKCIFCLCE